METHRMTDRSTPLAGDALYRALAASGVCFADLLRSAEQIILFGSRAAGLDRAGSDWDLLVVGVGRSRSAPGLDLIWVSPRELAGDDWLESELAGHVARWGRWLHGAPRWVTDVAAGVAAAENKSCRLASRIGALERTWELLPHAYRNKHHALVRRDLQRHALLLQSEPVPPSPLLDEWWRTSADPRDELLRLGQRAGVCSAFFEQALSRFSADTRPFTDEQRPGQASP